MNQKREAVLHASSDTHPHHGILDVWICFSKRTMAERVAQFPQDLHQCHFLLPNTVAIACAGAGTSVHACKHGYQDVRVRVASTNRFLAIGFDFELIGAGKRCTNGLIAVAVVNVSGSIVPLLALIDAYAYLSPSLLVLEACAYQGGSSC